MRVFYALLALFVVYVWCYIPELAFQYFWPHKTIHFCDKNFYNLVCLTDFIKIAAWAFFAGYLVPWKRWQFKLMLYVAFCFEIHSVFSFIIEKYYFDTFLSTNSKIASFALLVPFAIYAMCQIFHVFLNRRLTSFDKNATLYAVHRPMNHWALIPFIICGYGHTGVIQDGFFYTLKRVGKGAITMEYDLNDLAVCKWLKKDYRFMKTDETFDFTGLIGKETPSLLRYNCFQFVREARLKNG